MRRIIISWATIRPKMFTQTYKQWKLKADNKNFLTYVGCNTEEEKLQFEKLNPNNDNMITIPLGSDIKGVPTANYRLLQKLDFNDEDIIIIGADDFIPPKQWDSIIQDIYSRYDGCVIFNDGNPDRFKAIITIPILSGRLLKKMNKIIYHPAYFHNWADQEFFLNVTEMNEVADLRYFKPNIIFEHRHWLFQKRVADKVDQYAISKENEDRLTWEKRRNLPLEERLKV